MRGIKLLLTALLFSCLVQAQYVQNMGYEEYSFRLRMNIGNVTPKVTHPSAYLELGKATGSNMGLLLPRGTRGSVTSPAEGLLFYDKNDKKVFFYNGTSWVSTSAGTGTGSGTTAIDSISIRNDSLFYFDSDGTEFFGGVTVDPTKYYTKAQLQGDGTASVHWNNLTNIPASFGTTLYTGSGSFTGPRRITANGHPYTFWYDANNYDSATATGYYRRRGNIYSIQENGFMGLQARHPSWWYGAYAHMSNSNDSNYIVALFSENANVGRWMQASLRLDWTTGAGLGANLYWRLDDVHTSHKWFRVRHTDTTGVGAIEIDKELIPEGSGQYLVYDSVRKRMYRSNTGPGSGGGSSYTFRYSLTESGGNVNLVGDVASPGNSKYWGTNAIGVRGWYDLPAGGVGGGSGTVNSGTANQLAYYSATGTAVFGATGVTTDGTNLSIAGTVNYGNLATDPSGAPNGAKYYNTTTHRERTKVNGAFQNTTTDNVIGNVVQTEGIIYVSKNSATATDNRAGLSKYSTAYPFKTVQAAVNAMSDASGDIIYVMGGFYDEHVLWADYGDKMKLNLYLYGSRIRRLTAQVNAPSQLVVGYGDARIDTLENMYSPATGKIESVTLNMGLNIDPAFEFHNLKINVAGNMWPGTFENCTITSTRPGAIYQNYTLANGATFRECIFISSGDFVDQSGGLTSGGSPTFRFTRCMFELGGHFLSTRGTPKILIKDCNFKIGGRMFYNDGAGDNAIEWRIKDSYIITSTPSTSLLLLATADIVEWANITRNTSNLGTTPAGFISYGFDEVATNATYF